MSVGIVGIGLVFGVCNSLFRLPRNTPLYVKGIWGAMWAILVGQAVVTFCPSLILVGHHIIFIPGITLMIVCISIHVQYARAQLKPYLNAPTFAFKVMIILIIVTFFLRISANFASFYAVLLQFAAVLWWGYGILWWYYSETRVKRLLSVAEMGADKKFARPRT